MLVSYFTCFFCILCYNSFIFYPPTHMSMHVQVSTWCMTMVTCSGRKGRIFTKYIEDITWFSSGKNISQVEHSETSEMFWPREDKIHIFWKPCNVLFIIWVANKLL